MKCGSSKTYPVAFATALLATAPLAVAQHVYFSRGSTRDIAKMNLDGSLLGIFLDDSTEYQGVTVDVDNRQLYFAAFDDGPGADNAWAIRRIGLDGQGLEDVVLLDALAYGLALDPGGGKVYWTEAITDRVRRANLDGTAIEDLATGRFAPIGLALDLTRGKMYWTEMEQQDSQPSRVQVANLDGSGMTTFVGGLPTALGVAVDEVNERVYWTDDDGLHRADLSGGDVTLIIDGDFGDVKLDVENGKVYWRNPGLEAIERANLDGTSREVLVEGGVPYFLALDLGVGDCNGNGIDDEIDISKGTSRDCDGNGLPDECDEPQTDCNGNGVGDVCDILDGTSLDGDGNGRPDECCFLEDAPEPGCNQVQYVYWTTHEDSCDQGIDAIRRARLDGSDQQVIVAEPLGAVSNLHFDVAGGKMYWNDVSRELIERADLDGSHREEIISDVFARVIALDLVARDLYWFDADAVLHRANLDGSDAKTIGAVGRTIQTDLAIDPIAGKVYWTEWSDGLIMRANLDGSDVERIASQVEPDAVALDLWAGKIYWDFSRANLDGSGVESTPVSPGQIALDLPSGKVYWSEYFPAIPSAFLKRADLDGSHVETLDIEITGALGGIGVLPSQDFDCNGNGVPDACEPDDPPCETEACCFSDLCEDELPIACGGLGGIAQGPGTTCELASCELSVLIGTSFDYPCDASLSRARNNVLRFSFAPPVLLPTPGQVEIRELLPKGEVGPDLSGEFLFSLEDGGSVLRVAEIDEVLVNGSWYAVRNTGKWTSAQEFEVDYVVVWGDANNDRVTSFIDISAINAYYGDVSDGSRYDVNGSGDVSFVDLTATSAFVGSAASVKPDGHGCFP